MQVQRNFEISGLGTNFGFHHKLLNHAQLAHTFWQRLRAAALLTCSCLIGFSNLSSAACQDDPPPYERLDQPMYSSPAPVPQGRVKGHITEAIPLWVKALQQDRNELRIAAADAIVRAQGTGMPGLEVTIEPLIACYESEQPEVRRAAARALVALNATQAQPLFEKELPTAIEQVAAYVELGLANWKSQVARDYWREQLASPYVRPNGLQRAVYGLTVQNDVESAEAMRTIVLNPYAQLTSRLVASRGLGTLITSGLEPLATTLLDSKQTGCELLAAELLNKHSTEALAVQLRIIRSTTDPAAITAARRLLDLDPTLLYEDCIALSERRDRELRRIAIVVLEKRNEAADVERLLAMLDDRHPMVRHDARVACERLAASSTHRETIVNFVSEVAATRRGPEQWRILEQSCVCIGNLDLEANSTALLELLDESRVEVCCSAAWALRKIAVEATNAPILEYCTKILDGQDRRELPRPYPDELMSHLLQYLGEARYEPALPMMTRLIPKGIGYGIESRAASIWGIGLIREGRSEPELAQRLAERMMDGAGIPPEAEVVRRMSAITLGRMKSIDQMAALETTASPGVATDLGWVATWALSQIDGREIPIAPPYTKTEVDWFLTPLETEPFVEPQDR